MYLRKFVTLVYATFDVSLSMYACLVMCRHPHLSDLMISPDSDPHIIFLGYFKENLKSAPVRWHRAGLSSCRGSNTSTVALRVVGGDEKGTQCLGV
jgi:hypothetical protein